MSEKKRELICKKREGKESSLPPLKLSGQLSTNEGEKYRKGACDAMAIALHRKTGYPIYIVRGYFKEDDEEWSEDCHAVVKAGSDYIDFDGIHTSDDLISRCYFSKPPNRIKIEKISEEELNCCLSIEGISEEEIEKAIKDLEIKQKQIELLWKLLKSKEEVEKR